MMIRIIISALLAFLAAAAFGRFYIPWLKKHDFVQPLKKEVEDMYNEKAAKEKAAEESKNAAEESEKAAEKDRDSGADTE